MQTAYEGAEPDGTTDGYDGMTDGYAGLTPAAEECQGYMNGFAALDNSPCLRYVVVKATAGFAVCRLVLNLLLFYSCLDFTQNWGETRNKSFISIGGIKYGRVNYC